MSENSKKYDPIPGEGMAQYLARTLPRVFDRIDSVNNAVQEVAIKGTNEWKAYFPELPEEFKPNQKPNHHYGKLAVVDYPPGMKCQCQSIGKWPHLVHGGDPVLNFIADCTIENRITLKKILEILTEEKNPVLEDLEELKKNVKELKEFLM